MLEFERDNDILKKLGELKEHQILVGFAAESNDVIKNATGKLEKKNLDYIVANDINDSFGKDSNKVTIIKRDKTSIALGAMSKREVAAELFNIITENDL